MPRLRLVERRDAGGDVAPVERRNAAIVGEDVPQLLVEHAVPHQLDRAQAQTFLEHLVVPHVDAARRIAADIGAMDEGPGEAQQSPFHEHRPEQVDVVEVHHHAARGVRVVGHHHVARLPVVERLGAGVHRHAHDRRRAAAVGIGEDLALVGHQRNGEILRLLHECGVRGAQNDPRHLIDDGLEEVGEDLDA